MHVAKLGRLVSWSLVAAVGATLIACGGGKEPAQGGTSESAAQTVIVTLPSVLEFQIQGNVSGFVPVQSNVAATAELLSVNGDYRVMLAKPIAAALAHAVSYPGQHWTAAPLAIGQPPVNVQVAATIESVSTAGVHELLGFDMEPVKGGGAPLTAEVVKLRILESVLADGKPEKREHLYSVELSGTQCPESLSLNVTGSANHDNTADVHWQLETFKLAGVECPPAGHAYAYSERVAPGKPHSLQGFDMEPVMSVP